MKNTALLKNILKKTGYYKIQCTGHSMFPTIKEGEQITIVPADDLAIGEIILFEEGKNMILHRIIELNDSFIVTKGDNHPYSDHYIKLEQVIGKMKQMRQGTQNFSLPFNYSKFSGLTIVVWGNEVLSESITDQYRMYNISIEKIRC